MVYKTIMAYKANKKERGRENTINKQKEKYPHKAYIELVVVV